MYFTETSTSWLLGVEGYPALIAAKILAKLQNDSLLNGACGLA
jgi:hypothetical protein